MNYSLHNLQKFENYYRFLFCFVLFLISLWLNALYTVNQQSGGDVGNIRQCNLKLFSKVKKREISSENG